MMMFFFNRTYKDDLPSRYHLWHLCFKFYALFIDNNKESGERNCSWFYKLTNCIYLTKYNRMFAWLVLFLFKDKFFSTTCSTLKQSIIFNYHFYEVWNVHNMLRQWLVNLVRVHVMLHLMKIILLCLGLGI